MCLLLRGSKKGLFLGAGGGQCWNQPHERITNYCPLGHAQYWRRGGRAWLDGPAAGGFRGWVVLEVSVWSNTIKAILKGNTQSGPSLLFHPPLSPSGPAFSSLSPPPPLQPIPSLCFCKHRVPKDGPGVFYMTASCTSNTKQIKFFTTPSSFHLHHLPFTPSTRPACQSINHSTDLISRELAIQLKYRRKKGWTIWEMGLQVEQKCWVRCIALHTTSKFVGGMNYGGNGMPQVVGVQQAENRQSSRTEGVSTHTQI